MHLFLLQNLRCWCVNRVYVLHRNIVNISSTRKDCKRDFLIYLQNVMIVGGADKASYAELADARGDLLQKHQPSNMMVFGNLGYILLIATAGTRLQVEALPVAGAPMLTTIIAAFQVRTLFAACSVLLQVAHAC